MSSAVIGSNWTACISCGRGEDLKPIAEIMRGETRLDAAKGVLNPNAKVCSTCAANYSPEDIARESERLMLKGLDQTAKCGHCGEVFSFMGKAPDAPMWCESCDKELRRLTAEGKDGR